MHKKRKVYRTSDSKAEAIRSVQRRLDPNYLTKEEQKQEQLEQDIKSIWKHPVTKTVLIIGASYLALYGSKYVFNTLAQSVKAAKNLKRVIHQS